MNDSICDVCNDNSPHKKVESILLRVYFRVCKDCYDKYAEPREVIEDFTQRRDQLPDWFDDVSYYEDGHYKSAKNIAS